MNDVSGLDIVSEKSKFAYLDLSVLIWPSGERVPYKVQSTTISSYQALSGIISPDPPYQLLFGEILPDQARQPEMVKTFLAFFWPTVTPYPPLSTFSLVSTI